MHAFIWIWMVFVLILFVRDTESLFHVWNINYSHTYLYSGFLYHFSRNWVSSACEDKPSLVPNWLNSFTTLMVMASPSEYDHMSILFLNENTNGVLKGNQREAENRHSWFISKVPVHWLRLVSSFHTGQKTHIKHYSRHLPPCLQSPHLSSKGPSWWLNHTISTPPIGLTGDRWRYSSYSNNPFPLSHHHVTSWHLEHTYYRNDNQLPTTILN